MAATSHAEQETVHHEGHEDRTKTYILVALFLGAVTVVEVLTYEFAEFALWNWGEGKGLVVTLLFLAAVKFWTVAWFFMHLKWDKRLLNISFYSGVALALLLYLAVLTIFRVWWPAAHAVRMQ